MHGKIRKCFLIYNIKVKKKKSVYFKKSLNAIEMY
jgi:hypothetical protein